MNFIYFRPALLAILVLGFTSGLPLALTGSTLIALLSDYELKIESIGLFAVVAMPYAYKYLWSPLIDNLRIPILGKALGKRKSWLIVIQLTLAATIYSISVIDIKNEIFVLGLACFLISFLSATQDIIIDAFRIEMLKVEEQAAGAASAIFGYRLGMLASSAGALYLAHFYSWQFTYVMMALALVPGMVVGMICKDQKMQAGQMPKNLAFWLYESYKKPFQEFFLRKDWIPVLLLIVFYKMSDAYIGTLTNKFLLDTGFSKLQIANIVKLYGLAATLIGSFAAGIVLEKIGFYRALYLGLVLQITSNFVYIPVYYAGVNEKVLMFAIGVENFCSGLSNVFLVAYISKICNLKFTATHYAMLSSFAAFARTNLSMTSGYVVSYFGWPIFFVISATLSIPAFFFMKKATASLKDKTTKG